MMRGLWAIAAITLASCGHGRADEESGRERDVRLLKPYAGLVGSWRGSGLVRRGSAKGAWTEQAKWSWKLDSKSAGLVLDVEKGRHLKSATLKAESDKAFSLTAVLADDAERTFRGATNERGTLALVADPRPATGLARITLTPLHDTRLVVLFEAHGDRPDRFVRLGEVGYTREGAAFALGDSAPECIVTGGRGTIEVSHKGQTYYVCCTGCRDLFNQDPQAMLAEYRQRKKEK